MRWMLGMPPLLLCTGCSTAPLAGLMDWHNPSPAARPAVAEPRFPAGPIPTPPSALPPPGVYDPSRPGGAVLPDPLPLSQGSGSR